MPFPDEKTFKDYLKWGATRGYVANTFDPQGCEMYYYLTSRLKWSSDTKVYDDYYSDSLVQLDTPDWYRRYKNILYREWSKKVGNITGKLISYEDILACMGWDKTPVITPCDQDPDKIQDSYCLKRGEKTYVYIAGYFGFTPIAKCKLCNDTLIQCQYCNEYVTNLDEYTELEGGLCPPVYKDSLWKMVVPEHKDDCKWVRTRGLQRKEK